MSTFHTFWMTASNLWGFYVFFSTICTSYHVLSTSCAPGVVPGPSHELSQSCGGRNDYMSSFKDTESKPQRVWITHPRSHNQEEAKTKYLHRSADYRADVLSFLLDSKITSSFYLTTLSGWSTELSRKSLALQTQASSNERVKDTFQENMKRFFLKMYLFSLFFFFPHYESNSCSPWKFGKYRKI